MVSRALMAVTIRAVYPHEGPVLQALYLASGKPPLMNIDWDTDMGPFWFVAVDAQEHPVGCLQIRPSRPIATVELLCIPLDYTKRRKAEIALALITMAFHAVQCAGAQLVQFTPDEHMREFEKIVQRRGAQFYNRGNSYVMRLAHGRS